MPVLDVAEARRGRQPDRLDQNLVDAVDKLDANDGVGLGIFDATVGTSGALRELLPYISVTDD